MIVVMKIVVVKIVAVKIAAMKSVATKSVATKSAVAAVGAGAVAGVLVVAAGTGVGTAAEIKPLPLSLIPFGELFAQKNKPLSKP